MRALPGGVGGRAPDVASRARARGRGRRSALRGRAGEDARPGAPGFQERTVCRRSQAAVAALVSCGRRGGGPDRGRPLGFPIHLGHQTIRGLLRPGKDDIGAGLYGEEPQQPAPCPSFHPCHINPRTCRTRCSPARGRALLSGAGCRRRHGGSPPGNRVYLPDRFKVRGSAPRVSIGPWMPGAAMLRPCWGAE